MGGAQGADHERRPGKPDPDDTQSVAGSGRHIYNVHPAAQFRAGPDRAEAGGQSEPLARRGTAREGFDGQEMPA